jgi:lysophospholipase L1-like esterase
VDLVGRLPLFRRTQVQVRQYAAAWSAGNETACSGTGPLWVVLGDSAAQGVGASSHLSGYVGLVLTRLRAADGRPWRVVNLSRSGARTREDLCAALPPGAVVATCPRGVFERKSARVNAVLRARAAERGLRVADLWAHTGPPYRGRYADGFHPNDRGYLQWADALSDTLGLQQCGDL